MSETKHTPGVVQSIDDAIDELGQLHLRHCCKGQSFCRTLQVHDRLAHASLTVARLLATCENVATNLELQDFGPHNNWYRENAVNILRAAIAKAKL